MPYIYRNIYLDPADSEEALVPLAASRLGIPAHELQGFRIVRKGIDARRRVRVVYTVSFTVADPAISSRLADIPNLEWQDDVLPHRGAPVSSSRRIVITGSGPAGLFAALRLGEYGLTATLVERGKPVEERARDVQRFWDDGLLDLESNVQFGEGGAGTFSDGKLTCRTRDQLITPWVLERLVAFGAPPEIRYLAKPHIGTDRLRTVIAAIREHLLARGFEFRFSSRLTDIVIRNGAVAAIILNDRHELPCDLLLLATGHSARDTYELLERRNVALERKPFAIGLRVEHPQELIDRIQYGGPRHPNLPPADYAVTWNNPVTGRSAYSFCMCPGGVVVAGASEPEGVVTNGMSDHLRTTPFANSALVVNVAVGDLPGPGPLAGIRFQRQWEQEAFRAGGGGYRAPAQDLRSFVGLGGTRPLSGSYRPGITEADLSRVLPSFVVATLREGIVEFDRKLRGFASAEATLIGIESRTSAPVRVLRSDRYESVNLSGLYPTGEGAGYAGGIMSSATDGIRVADTIAAKLEAESSARTVRRQGA
jgi:uncharacterized FAD-dependent dehydrogenase